MSRSVMDARDEELWRHWPRNKDYGISTRARVLRVEPGQGARPGLRKIQKHNARYAFLRLPVDGVMTGVLIHIMMADTWLEAPLPEQTDINHLDGNKRNNWLYNLKRATRLENVQHARDVLRRGHHTITVEDAMAVRQLFNEMHTQSEIAQATGVSQKQVSMIVLGDSWPAAAAVVPIVKSNVHLLLTPDPGPVEWRTPTGYQSVEVSNYGILRDAETKVPMALQPDKRNGEYATTVRGQSVKVHQLVALAFIGPRPGLDYDVNHRNLDRGDNRITNLEYTTHDANMRHRFGYAYKSVRLNAVTGSMEEVVN